jgi:hypothetical protein
MDNELERLRKEAVMAYFKVLSRHLHAGTEQTDKRASVGIAYLRVEI